MAPAVPRTAHRPIRRADVGSPMAYAAIAFVPFYILHQTVIIVIGCSVVQWHIAGLLKYLVICLSSLALSLLIYEIVNRRTHPHAQDVRHERPARRVRCRLSTCLTPRLPSWPMPQGSSCCMLHSVVGDAGRRLVLVPSISASRRKSGLNTPDRVINVHGRNRSGTGQLTFSNRST